MTRPGDRPSASARAMTRPGDRPSASARAMATARWRERKAIGSFMVPVEVFQHEVEALVRRGLLQRDQADDRYAVGYAIAQLVERLLK
jgi:hypothetical protein